MRKTDKNNGKSSTVELILVIVVLVLIGINVWITYHDHNKTANSAANRSTTTIKSSK